RAERPAGRRRPVGPAARTAPSSKAGTRPPAPTAPPPDVVSGRAGRAGLHSGLVDMPVAAAGPTTRWAGPVRAPSAAVIFRGVYKVEGDTLTLCSDGAGPGLPASRPAPSRSTSASADEAARAHPTGTAGQLRHADLFLARRGPLRPPGRGAHRRAVLRADPLAHRAAPAQGQGAGAGRVARLARRQPRQQPRRLARPGEEGQRPRQR